MLEVIKLLGHIDGESPIDTAGDDHVAGQPAKLTSSGWQLATAPGDVLGLFKSDMYVDVAGGPQAADAPATGFSNAGVLIGLNKVKLTPGLLQDKTVQAPFVYPATGSSNWAIGDKIYVTALGFWDNAPAAVDDPTLGIVTSPPASATGTLEAVMFAPVNAVGASDLAGLLSADAAGRAVMADNFFDATTVTSKFEDGAIPVAKIAGGAGVAALIAAGVGASHEYDHTADVGTNTLLAADATNDRAVLIVAVVTVAFAGTTKPLFKIGETSTVTKFGQIGEGQLAGTPVGKTYVFAGTLTATKALLVTVTDGSGGTPAGKLDITVLAMPAAV